MFIKETNVLIRKFDNETVLLQPWGENSLRIRVTMNSRFTDQDWALIAPKKTDSKITVSKSLPNSVQREMLLGTDGTEEIASITNGKITGSFDMYGVLTFTNQEGKVLLTESWKRLRDNPSIALNLFGREFKPISSGSFRTTLRFLPNDKEKLYGMGQYQMPYLNIKGCELELAQRNSQASVPFVVSNIGYGFLWNNPAIGRVVFGKNGTEWVAESTEQADYWITAGDTPAEIEESYANVTGKEPMMPEYGMGFWQCKLRYRSQEELLNVAREYKRRGLPLSVIVADFFHWTQQGEYKFDPKFWPDPKAMCKELHDMGTELMVSIWPTVDYRSENFNEMMEIGLLVRTERGVRVTMQMFGQEVFIDPTNPETRKFVWSKAKQNYFDNGVNIFWLDEAEPEYTVYDYDNYRYYIGSNLEVGNIYPAMYAKTFYDGMVESGIKNPLNLLRCAWAGSQKYGALVWSGDIDSTYECFRRQVRAGLSMGMAGIPWWTTDIGGFHGTRADNPDFRELLMRWFEYGCFCPVFRLHGNRSPITGFTGDRISGIGEFGTGADNEVWSYGEECYEIMKKYIFLRERIKPYITAQMKAAHEKGTPVMRPLFYDFPADKQSWDVDDQYMFGPDILVAPIMEKGQFAREVYLPDGALWKNAWTDETVTGGNIVNVKASIDQIPIFLKNDADVPIKV